MADPIELFWMRLALVFGQPHPDRLKEQLPASVFYRWIAYSLLEPFGPHGDNLQSALICSTMVNSMSGIMGGKTDIATVRDFMFGVNRDEDDPSPEAKANREMAEWAAAMNDSPKGG